MRLCKVVLVKVRHLLLVSNYFYIPKPNYVLIAIGYLGLKSCAICDLVEMRKPGKY